MTTPPDDRCARVRLDAMARADGEAPLMPEAEARAHLEGCAACREEIDASGALATAFAGRRRAEVADPAMWPRVRERLPEPAARAAVSPVEVGALCLLAGLLAAYKAIEVTPGIEVGLAVKLLPLLATAVVFAVLRQNPLRIEVELGGEAV